MGLRTGYKQTEVGVIPSDWEVKKLDEIATIIGGGTPSTNEPSFWNGDINWFTPTEIGLNKYSFESVRKITKLGLENSSARVLPIGTILLTTRAGIGDVSILMNEASTNQGFQSFVSNENFNNEYIYYLIFTLKNIFLQNASGSTFLEISPKKIKAIKVAVPTITEQTLIATTLSDADTLISSLEKLIIKKRNIKQGAMQKLLQPKKGWEVKKLGDICDFSSGTAHENFIDSRGNYVVVNSKFISTNGEVRKYANTLFCPANIGDILIVLSDVPNGKAIAKCFLIDKDDFYTVNQRIGIIKPFQNISSKFLYFLINRHPCLLAFDDGAKQTNLRNQDINGLPLTIPKSKEEQSNIATILSDMDAEIATLESKLEKYKSVKTGMMQNLLTGKIRLI